MKYVSIDLETTGLDPESCDIVEFGAVIDDLTKPRPIETLPKFHAYVLPVCRQPVKMNGVGQRATYQGDPYALSMHQKIFQRIAKKEAPYLYYEPEILIRHFSEFLRTHELTTNIVMVGKNFASFDLPFLKKIRTWYLLNSSYRTFDPTALFFKVGEDMVPPGMKACLDRAGLKSDVSHTAISDAQQVVRLMRHGLLVKEPADFKTVPEEPEKQMIKYGHGQRGCSVVLQVKDGKPTPTVVPSTSECLTDKCSLIRMPGKIYCHQHYFAAQNAADRNTKAHIG